MGNLTEAAFDLGTQRYLQLLEGLRQAVIGTDNDGAIIYWSKAAEELYGWPREEVLGRSVLDITPTDLSKSAAVEIMRTLVAGAVWSGSFAVRSRKNASFEVSVTDVPLMDGEQHVAGVIGVSAPSRALTDVVALAREFAAVCDEVWPGKISLKLARNAPTIIAASKPHVGQLFALLFARFAESLDGGAAVEIAVGPAEGSPFTDFYLASPSDGDVYIRIGQRHERRTYGILRDVLKSAEATEYGAALVGMLGGQLMLGATSLRPATVHLLLPAHPRA